MSNSSFRPNVVMIRFTVTELPEKGPGKCTVHIQQAGHEPVKHENVKLSTLLSWRVRQQRKLMAGEAIDVKDSFYDLPMYEFSTFTCLNQARKRAAGPLSFTTVVSPEGEFEYHVLGLVEEAGSKPTRSDVAGAAWQHFYKKAEQYRRINQVVRSWAKV